MNNIKEFLKELGAKNGLAIELNEDGACTLPLAENRVLHIQLREDIGELDLVAMLGDIPDEARPAIFESMLAANYYWKETFGATLAWHRELAQPLIELPIQIEHTDEDAFETIFANFMELQDAWTKRLERDAGVIVEEYKNRESDADDDDDDNDGNVVTAAVQEQIIIR